MKRLISMADSLMLDRKTKDLLSIQDIQLMEKASLRIWDSLRSALPELRHRWKKILAVAGKGDNGGDALAILRHAWSSGFLDVSAIISSGSLKPTCAAQAASLSSLGIPVVHWDDLDEEELKKLISGADVILDGILGTGSVGPARGEAGRMIGALCARKASAKIVSIDVPSGIGDDYLAGRAAVNADLCCTLLPLKIPLFLPEARRHCGSIRTIDDVFPKTLIDSMFNRSQVDGPVLLEMKDLPRLLLGIEAGAYKNSRGRVVVFAGSEGQAGAARLCAKAALSVGAGYCTLYADPGICASIIPDLEPVVVKPFSGTSAPELLCDALVVGPGWGEGPERKTLLESLLGQHIPLVVDAAAIRILASLDDRHFNRDSVLAITPHPGEFSALAKAKGISLEQPFLEAIKEVSKTYQAIIVYKSHITILCDPQGKIAFWDGMTPELGTAGSGDVLAGMIGGIIALFEADFLRKGSTLDYACARHAAEGAVLIHGLSGQRLAKSKGWFTADQLIPEGARLAHEIMQTREGA
jgi:NAD(P)H-hydrate epimerase